jgi:glycosyltransferase involved in cell wall biosynthesis
VAAQGDEAAEVVVVDDGSDNSVADLVTGSEVATARVVEHGQHRGMVANWNAAVRQATAPLVILLSQDDELVPGALAAYRAAFGEEPGLVACSAATVPIDDAGRVRREPRRPNQRSRIYRHRARYLLDGDELVRLCLRNGQAFGEPSAVVFRREAFESVGGFRHEFGHVADIDLDLRLASVGPVAYLTTPLVRRRVHAAMQTARDKASGETTAARLRLHEEWIGHPALDRRDRARARVAVASWAARDAVKAVARGRWRDVRSQLAVVGRYGANPPRYIAENAWEIVTGRNRDAR